jgi:hypothetical protein
MPDAQCCICGKTEKEHEHRFKAFVPAVGCVCNPREWIGELEAGDPKRMAVCDNYKRGDWLTRCDTCGHPPACHERKTDG